MLLNAEISVEVLEKNDASDECMTLHVKYIFIFRQEIYAGVVKYAAPMCMVEGRACSRSKYDVFFTYIPWKYFCGPQKLHRWLQVKNIVRITRTLLSFLLHPILLPTKITLLLSSQSIILRAAVL